MKFLVASLPNKNPVRAEEVMLLATFLVRGQADTFAEAAAVLGIHLDRKVVVLKVVAEAVFVKTVTMDQQT